MEKSRIRDLLPLALSLYLTACQTGADRIAQVDPTATATLPTPTEIPAQFPSDTIPLDQYDLFTYESVAFAYQDQTPEIAFSETLRAIASRTHHNNPNGYTFVQFAVKPNTESPIGLLVGPKGTIGTGIINTQGDISFSALPEPTTTETLPVALQQLLHAPGPVHTAILAAEALREYYAN